MIQDDIRQLEAALEAGPTPGPWAHAFDFGQIGSVEAEGFPVAQVQQRASSDNERRQLTAAYIAAANPVVLRRLLDHIKALEAAVYPPKPSRCDACKWMGNYGHGEPPPCRHPFMPIATSMDMFFCNPRSEPPTWCPLRRL
jgi:hypothetical protein